MVFVGFQDGQSYCCLITKSVTNYELVVINSNPYASPRTQRRSLVTMTGFEKYSGIKNT